MIIGYKAVCGGIVKLRIRDEDYIGADPEMSTAHMASCAYVERGGGASLADTSFRYVKGRWVFPVSNSKAIWRHGPSAIYFWSSREEAVAYLKKMQ